MAKVHALIIGHLRAQMPMFGQKSKQEKLIAGMADEFYAVMKKHRLPQGDFPNISRFQVRRQGRPGKAREGVGTALCSPRPSSSCAGSCRDVW